MRRGLDRRPGLVPVPAKLLGAALRASGRAEMLERLAGSLVVDPSALMRVGWTPRLSPAQGLAQLMQGPA
jgi:UDP-glucose 4-epimerase